MNLNFIQDVNKFNEIVDFAVNLNCSEMSSPKCNTVIYEMIKAKKYDLANTVLIRCININDGIQYAIYSAKYALDETKVNEELKNNALLAINEAQLYGFPNFNLENTIIAANEINTKARKYDKNSVEKFLLMAASHSAYCVYYAGLLSNYPRNVELGTVKESEYYKNSCVENYYNHVEKTFEDALNAIKIKYDEEEQYYFAKHVILNFVSKIK